jgi:2-amino-4-hydroxy-6-hydroxymethyldihydropteridine diphosphokinase
LDIDLLIFDDLIVHDSGLDIPRKDIIDYAYVAIPLSEIAGDQQHPETGESFKEISNADSIAVQRIWHSKFQHQGEM